MLYHNTFRRVLKKRQLFKSKYKDPASIIIFVNTSVRANHKSPELPIPDFYL